MITYYRRTSFAGAIDTAQVTALPTHDNLVLIDRGTPRAAVRLSSGDAVKLLEALQFERVVPSAYPASSDD